MSDTLKYYRENAQSFFDETLTVDMSSVYEPFLRHIPEGGLILDAGCGSGRDSKAFLELGFRVRPFDACPELAVLAAMHINDGNSVPVRTFLDVEEEQCYDGVWACASLLHVPSAHLPEAIARLWRSLKPGGAFYASFRHGTGERVPSGRHFTDADESQMQAWLDDLPGLATKNVWISKDHRPLREDLWLNVVATRQKAEFRNLVTGGERSFLPHLCHAIAKASEIDLAVAFVKITGWRLLLPDLQSALSERKARVRVLTSDYLDVTDPEALRSLMLLQREGAHVRVYQSSGGSFHLKAYLFSRFDDGGRLSGSAFIGSSNITRQALKGGLEWNYRVDYPGDDGFLEARSRFEELFDNPRSIPLTHEWIQEYEARRVAPSRAIAPGSQEQEPPPQPTTVQAEALSALATTRSEGFRRGLVVMATGLGKTWLAAFDAAACNARKILFVAHREEILHQAAQTFLRIRPRSAVGYYMGTSRDVDVDVVCASIQTIARNAHLERFSPRHFDYIVVDEFHHASAPTYRRLLNNFEPRFLLGLTATPDRTDQTDILSLCDDNEVFSFNLFRGVTERLLANFHYHGIFDENVDYRELPWRSPKLLKEALDFQLATDLRAAHVLREWRAKAQARTLAFCVSIRHADFMAAYFSRGGVEAVAVHGQSAVSRGQALEGLQNGSVEVVFSVDLFNEGVDLPEIDTVMLLRPTESKVLFLQQIGRGLRLAKRKDHLVILDYIGNHQAFLHKPQALFGVGSTYRDLAAFAIQVELGTLSLPPGCFVNYDLRLIEFLKSLDASQGIEEEYEALREVLDRRPTLLEFYRAGANIRQMRQRFGGWFHFVRERSDLSQDLSQPQAEFLRELETTPMTKSYKMVLLEAMQELDGWREGPSLEHLAARSWEILHRRRPLLGDLPEELRELSDAAAREWIRYWRENPVNAWIGGNTRNTHPFFRIVADRFVTAIPVESSEVEAFASLVQEMVDFRLATYESRRTETIYSPIVVPIRTDKSNLTRLPYYPNLRIACGHFGTGTSEGMESRRISNAYGHTDAGRHFLVRAAGHSMDGGKNPIRDGDHLLMEWITASSAGAITGSVMAIERQDAAGDDQYLLRSVLKRPDGSYILRANNPDFGDMEANEEFRTLARFKAVVNSLEMNIGRRLSREEVAPLFGVSFNIGNWNSGHVVLREQKVHVLLVTLNKRGKAQDHRYLDHWVDDQTFHWQSQNQTSPNDARGREIIQHATLGITIHLFVREEKLSGGKSAAFLYCGPVDYLQHSGTKPMSVMFRLRLPRD